LVQRPNEIVAAQRARWLAELAAALGEARRLVKEFGAAEGRLDAIELYTQIESLRLEVELLQRQIRSDPFDEFGPNRTKTPWQHGRPGSAEFSTSGAD
jgi:hypothetical protein